MAIDILLFASNEDPRPVTAAWERYATSKGLNFEKRIGWHSAFNTGDRVRSIEEARLVLIWNGADPGTEWVARVCREFERPYVFVEWGLLPQAEYFHIDSTGIVGDSSLCGSLSWVTDEHVDAYHIHRDRHLSSHDWSYQHDEEGFVLVPLQIEHDSAIYLHSPIATNQALVDMAEQLFPDRDIVVRPHPRNINQVIETKRAVLEKIKSTMDLAQFASQVIGMNSTVLLETAMLGVPTMPIAKCPLYYHQQEVERLLAACVARQIPRSVTDLGPWLRALGIDLD